MYTTEVRSCIQMGTLADNQSLCVAEAGARRQKSPATGCLADCRTLPSAVSV